MKNYNFILNTPKGEFEINNPFSGVLIIGNAGSGKTVSLINQILDNVVLNNYTGLIYDFTFPRLSERVYSLIQKNDIKTQLFPINFIDLEKTYRFNPLNPKYILDKQCAVEYTDAIFENLEIKNDFLDKSAKNYFTAIMIYLKKFHPKCCTLPHLLASCKEVGFKSIINKLKNDLEISFIISNIIGAYKKEAYDQISAILLRLKDLFKELNSEEIFWVLSGNDIDLDLIKTQDQKIITLGGSPMYNFSLAPLNALITTVITKHLNKQTTQSKIVLLDEASSFKFPWLIKLLSEKESNLSVVLSFQAIEQIKYFYKDDVNIILSNLDNRFIGNTISKDIEYMKNINLAELNELRPGQFLSSVTDKSENVENIQFNMSNDITNIELPVIKKEIEIKQNYLNIINDVKSIFI